MLINVEIVTEGVDIPHLKTVFLARPTHSTILLRQMVGRALRKAPGKTHAYLVSFDDHWERHRDWAIPLGLVIDESETFPDPIKKSDSSVDATIFDALNAALPWQLICDAAAVLRNHAHSIASAFEEVHHGWYSVSTADVESESIIIPVFKHQVPCWSALVNELSSLNTASRQSQNAKLLFEEYFGDCDTPRPADYDVVKMLAHFQSVSEPPEYVEYAERSKSDPIEIAKMLFEKSMSEQDKYGLIKECHKATLARAIYPRLRDFQVAVREALLDISDPDGSSRIEKGEPVFERWPNLEVPPGPDHDLTALWRGMTIVAKQLLKTEPKPQFNVELVWTKRNLKGWFGKAFWDMHLIKINFLLKRPLVSKDTMKFLLWHEFLHCHLKEGHTKQFRTFERMWPGKVAADRELDTLNEKYHIKYWGDKELDSD